MHILMEAETWVAVAFVIFLGILAYVGVHRTILDTLDRRSARIKAELDEARQLRDEAKKLLAEYQNKKGEAERQAEAQAVADVRAAAAEAAVAAAEKVLTQAATGKIAESLVTQGIADVQKKLN
jgi:F-type H+-transporting ATPase subunit b